MLIGTDKSFRPRRYRRVVSPKFRAKCGDLPVRLLPESAAVPICSSVNGNWDARRTFLRGTEEPGAGSPSPAAFLSAMSLSFSGSVPPDAPIAQERISDVRTKVRSRFLAPLLPRHFELPLSAEEEKKPLFGRNDLEKKEWKCMREERRSGGAAGRQRERGEE